MRTCFVIGGGAAGMLAAIQASSKGLHVELFEKNEKLGKKIFITGKGRCNITNDCPPEEFFENIVTNQKFMYSSFYSFDNQAMISMLENAGCHIKIERGNRVFPQTDHSSDVIKTLQVLLKQNDVMIHLNSPVDSLLTSDGFVNGIRLKSGEKKYCDYVVLATGGSSYPSTGSTGDGYRMAVDVGHTITEIKPALVPFVVKEEWCKSLQGLSLKNIAISIHDNKKNIYNGFGEFLFTHFGVSGPLVLSASSYYSKYAFNRELKLNLDLKPALSEEQLDSRILRDFDEYKNKQFKNSLGKLLPSKLIPVIITLSEISPEKEVNMITKEERKQLVYCIKNMNMTICGVRPLSEAIITQGGIKVKEVNPSTMESKVINNLYFAGEILDVDALTGGFNLQIAWSTGYLAGNSIVEGDKR